MVVYGYVRVSSADQQEDRQLNAMSELRIQSEHIFTDKLSGKDFERPAYNALIKILRPGDLLWILSIDRLGRRALRGRFLRLPDIFHFVDDFLEPADYDAIVIALMGEGAG